MIAEVWCPSSALEQVHVFGREDEEERRKGGKKEGKGRGKGKREKGKGKTERGFWEGGWRGKETVGKKERGEGRSV
jgi:hypothetical protein